jgi:hypothetical protein
MQTFNILNLLFQNGILLQASGAEDEEFNLFLLTLLILGMVFMVVSVVIAVALAVISLLVIFGFVAIGALSASVIVGINKKSFTTGFRTFVIIFSTLSMGLLGTGALWLLNRIFYWFTQSIALITGLCLGLISGFAAGLLIAFLIKKISTALKLRIETKTPA